VHVNITQAVTQDLRNVTFYFSNMVTRI